MLSRKAPKIPGSNTNFESSSAGQTSFSGKAHREGGPLRRLASAHSKAPPAGQRSAPASAQPTSKIYQQYSIRPFNTKRLSSRPKQRGFLLHAAVWHAALRSGGISLRLRKLVITRVNRRLPLTCKLFPESPAPLPLRAAPNGRPAPRRMGNRLRTRNSQSIRGSSPSTGDARETMAR